MPMPTELQRIYCIEELQNTLWNENKTVQQLELFNKYIVIVSHGRNTNFLFLCYSLERSVECTPSEFSI